MIDRIEAGERLRDARKNANLSQEAAARMLGMTRQQLSGLETGRRVPTWPRLVEMVEKLGLDPRMIVPEFFASTTTAN